MIGGKTAQKSELSTQFFTRFHRIYDNDDLLQSGYRHQVILLDTSKLDVKHKKNKTT